MNFRALNCSSRSENWVNFVGNLILFVGKFVLPFTSKHSWIFFDKLSYKIYSEVKTSKILDSTPNSKNGPTTPLAMGVLCMFYYDLIHLIFHSKYELLYAHSILKNSYQNCFFRKWCCVMAKKSFKWKIWFVRCNWKISGSKACSLS